MTYSEEKAVSALYHTIIPYTHRCKISSADSPRGFTRVVCSDVYDQSGETSKPQMVQSARPTELQMTSSIRADCLRRKSATVRSIRGRNTWCQERAVRADKSAHRFMRRLQRALRPARTLCTVSVMHPAFAKGRLPARSSGEINEDAVTVSRLKHLPTQLF